MHPSLTAQLQAFRASLMQRLPVQERNAIEPAYAALRAALRASPVVQVGAVVPDFILPDQHGRLVHLYDRLENGPVVLLFVRGGWCPFCTMTLRAYQAALPSIHEAGADLLAITPQPAGPCSQMAERDLLAFPTLSDQDNQVARRYGIAFEIEPSMRPMHLRLGHDLPRINQTQDWTVPLPATFIAGRDRRLALAHVEAGAHQRLEPAAAIAALTDLAAQAAAA